MIPLISEVQESGTEFQYISKVIVPVFTFIVGWLFTQFAMSKKERSDHRDRQQKNVETYQENLNDEFDKFTNALAKYAKLKKRPTIQDFLSISQAGERYFTQLKMIADATFENTIPVSLSISVFSQSIREAHERSIPKFYGVLKEIAEKRDMEWEGEFRRANYESIESYYERFCLE